MIKTILVPTSGTTTDESVFSTALAIAKPLDAHLDFYHVRLSECEAAVRTPHLPYCPAAVLGASLAQLRDQEDVVSAAAAQHVEEFCEVNGIETRATPPPIRGMTAQRLEEIDRTVGRFVFHARHRDLSVLGRPHAHDQLRDNLIESVLSKSGRPVVIAPESAPRRALETIVIAWNESCAAAHALAASLPLLKTARNVVLLGLGDHAQHEVLDAVLRHLEWHGIRATVHRAKSSPSHPPLAGQLLDAALELGADLLVAGGYGHMPLREVVFGGVTQSLIEHAEIPIMLMH